MQKPFRISPVVGLRKWDLGTADAEDRAADIPVAGADGRSFGT
jgi:hypothetical protein